MTTPLAPAPGASGMTLVYRPTPQFVFIHMSGRYSQTHVSNGTANRWYAPAFTHGNVLPWNLQTGFDCSCTNELYKQYSRKERRCKRIGTFVLIAIPSRHQKERPFIPGLKTRGFLARHCKRPSKPRWTTDKVGKSSVPYKGVHTRTNGWILSRALPVSPTVCETS